MSEFGSGVVIPLVKFTRHLNDHNASQLKLALRWAEIDPSDRLAIIEQGAPEFAAIIAITERMDVDELIAMWGMIWANGASDHLIDLDLKRSPESLKDLRAMLLELRYAGPDNKFDETQWRAILSLWKESAMDIDDILGTQGDWGDVG